MASVRLGDYELGELIGRGGMGAVWAATHRLWGLGVAIKTLRAERAASAEWRADFAREARVVAQLDHDRIVRVLDVGMVDAAAAAASGNVVVAGTPYLVMERIEGTPLSAMRGRLDWPALRAVLTEILRALGHAHARGVLHRDVKPSNVLIGRAMHDVKVTDFGIAHLEEAGGVGAQAGGTPAYMAPEQMLGQWREEGPWTDLYSLGCVAWDLATGAPPFGRGDVPFERLLAGHARSEPPAFLPTFAAPSGLEAWIRALLEKDPRKRPRRAADAMASLRLVGQGGAASSVVPRPAARAPRIDEERTPVSDAETTHMLMGRDTLPPDGVPIVQLEPEIDTLPSRRVEHSARAPRSTRSGLGIFRIRRLPLLGREEEREALWNALDQAHADAHPAAVVIRGAAGTGKSRLAEWLAEVAHESGAATVLTALHDELGDPHAGVYPMLARHFRVQGLAPRDALERVDRRLIAIGVDDPLDRRLVAELVAATGGVGATIAIAPARAAERHAVVARVLARASRLRPLVLWIEDAQWGADALELARTVLAADAREPSSIAVVITAREDVLAERRIESELLERIVALPRVRSIHLGPLQATPMQHLVRELLWLEPELAARVETRAAGSPMYAAELVQDWVARGLLEPGAEGLRLRAGAVELPADVQAVWASRIESALVGRRGADRDAFEIAAVLGQTLDPSEWLAACRNAGVSPSADLVELLADRGLVRRASATSGEWAFAHALLRESVVAAAEASGRGRGWHLACAAALAPSAGAQESERRGRHLLAAGDAVGAFGALLTAAVSDLRADEIRSAELALAAARAALASAGLDPGDPRRGELAAVEVELAVRVAPATDGARLARALFGQARVHGWGRARALALVHLGDCRRRLGHPRALRTLLAAERRAVELGDPLVLHEARQFLFRYHLVRAELDRAEAIATMGLETVDRTAVPHGAAQWQFSLAQVSRKRGDLPRVVEVAHATLAEYERIGIRDGMALATNMLGEAARYSGDLELAEQHYRRAYAVWRAIGSPKATPAAANLAHVFVSAGRFDEAWEIVSRALDERDTSNSGIVEIHVRALALACAAARLDPAGWDEQMAVARPLLQQAIVRDVDLALAFADASELATEAGWLARAREALGYALEQERALGRAEAVEELERRQAAIELLDA